MGRKYIEGADFCLESATERTPDPRRFYILASEEIVCDFDSREEAMDEYHRRCVLFWNAKMQSRREADRLMGARGILSLDKSHLGAWEELARLGNQSERAKAVFWIRKLSGEEVEETAAIAS